METILYEEPMQEWFGLSYCSYLTIPRSILQSMPVDWQKKLVELLNEAGRLYQCPEKGSYTVYVRDEEGKFIHDFFRDYERGRRRVEPNIDCEVTK